MQPRWGRKPFFVPKRQRESLRNPPKSGEELLITLEGQGLTQAVARLRHFLDAL
jgi:hypothetical protein